MTKEKVLALLQAHPDQFISGQDLAASLQLSRTAVWKAVSQLRSEGYPIQSVPRNGHRLSSESDVLSESGIRRYLANRDLDLRVFPTISSTNTVLKQMAQQEAPAPLALVAAAQTAGRGRMGRSFYSPADTGLYLSLLLRPDLPVMEATALTACAAVSVAEALESLADLKIGIKWVNDLFLDGRKICGILTEAGLEGETGRMSYVVIGIGINLRTPEGDFPAEIQKIAGPAFGKEPLPDLRNRLSALILDRMLDYAARPGDPAILEGYRRRSLVPGKEIQILAPGKEAESALALAIEQDYALRVRMPDGTERLLRTGEISIRMS